MSEKPGQKSNLAIIGVGSNIDPEYNVQRAKEELGAIGETIKESKFIYTKPLLFAEQPDFLNGAFLLETASELQALKKSLKEIEARLGRVRGPNKNGPRTIDLDVIVFNGVLIDEDVYERDFLKDFVLELLPGFPL